MIRAVWYALIAAVAIVAIGAQIDRQSRRQPELAAAVPGPFRSFAQAIIAEAAIAGEDGSAALEQAQRLVSKRPVPAENLLILSAAQQQAGDGAKAVETIQHAALRGWRLAPAQEAMLQIALSQNDMTEAANRLAALWALRRESPQMEELTRSVLSTQEGLAAFSQQLAATRKWQDHFVRLGPQVATHELAVRAIALANKRGADFDCAALSSMAHSLAARGWSDEARSVWSGSCAENKESGPANAGFQPDRGPSAGPFEWRYPNVPRMVRTIRPSGKGWELDFVGRDPARQPVASRIISLKPGAHELELSAQGGSGFLQADVHCLDREGRRLSLGTLADEGRLAFTVPQTGCPVQVVDLKAGVASRNRLRITID